MIGEKIIDGLAGTASIVGSIGVLMGVGGYGLINPDMYEHELGDCNVLAQGNLEACYDKADARLEDRNETAIGIGIVSLIAVAGSTGYMFRRAKSD